MTMMKLGPLTFSIATAAYQELQRTTAYRWESQNRFGQQPALQFCGKGDETCSLSGTIYPHYNGGLGQVENMRSVSAEGKPLLLVSGTGELLGKWAVLSITEKQTIFFADGRPRKMTFALSLKRVQ